MKVLLVEDNPADARLIQEMLQGFPRPPGEPMEFELTRVVQLSEALRTLAGQTFDVVLLDSGLADSRRLETLASLLESHVPIVVLTGLNDEVAGLEALRRGAQDCLAKTGLGIELLTRTLRYAAERRRAQETLLGSEARHLRLAEANLLQSTALASTANGVVITDRQGTIQWVNPAFEALTGYQAQEVLGQNPRLLKSGQHRPEFYGELWRTISGGNVWRGVFINRRKDGTLYHDEHTITPVRSGGGQITHFVAIMQDITQRKKAEAELRGANRTLSMVSECNQVLVRAGSEAELLQRTCRTIVDLGGYRLAWVGLVQQARPDCLSLAAHAGGNSGFLEAAQALGVGSPENPGPIRLALRTSQPAVCADLQADPMACACRDEALRHGYASVIALPLLSRGHTLGVLTIYAGAPGVFDVPEIKLLEELASDLAYGLTAQRTRLEREQAQESLRASEITARQRAEELEKLMDLAPIAIWVAHDPQCHRITGNRTANFLYEASPGENVSAAPASGAHDTARRFFQHGRELKPEELPMQEAAANGKDVRHSELDVVSPSGRKLTILGNASPLRDDEGRIRGCIGAFVDISERKQAEVEIRTLNAELDRRVRDRTAQLEAANEELEAFSYSVSHDLRAPLRHTAGFVDLLNRTAGSALTGKSRHYLKQITDSVSQMGRLIDDLLEFSRMGRADLRQEPLDLRRLAEEVIRDLQSQIEGRNILWKVARLPEVQADRSMLRQVWMNLLSNAVKYTRPRATAEVEIGCAKETADEVVVFVRDNGVGFDVQYAGKLFGVFQRLHLDHEFEGTGIGLANVRRIIARHGGRTWAEGQVDGGASFFFSLPKTKHPQDDTTTRP